MDTFLEWIQRHIHGEITVVTGAPTLFFVCILIVGIIEFVALRAHFGERLNAMQANIDHKQSRLDEYKERLNNQTPLEVAETIVDLRSQIQTLRSSIYRPQRRITDEQKNTIKEYLADAPECAELWFTIATTADVESARFGVNIHDALRDCNIQTTIHHAGRHDEGERGIILYTPPDASYPALDKIVEALEKVGFPVTKTVDIRAPTQTYLFVTPDVVDAPTI